MQITIDNKRVDVVNGETLLEAARRVGLQIPSLCYAEGAKHKSSCMVCAVKNAATGQIIPSCSTLPTEGMQIEADSEEVHQIRRLSLELLLSDHRADCEAPCVLVCPQRLDIERMLNHYDNGNHKKAYEEIDRAFNLPEIACDTCKAPCEKACRRGTVDEAVSIRAIIKEVAGMFAPKSPKGELPNHSRDAMPCVSTIANPLKEAGASYQSRLGRFTDKEKQRLKEAVATPSRCLHCACAGQDKCRLRTYATEAGIKRSRYKAISALPVMDKMHVVGDLWFEQAKCIRCGLCVYNTENGFTFKDRGFGMQVIIPEENKPNASEDMASLCPTGALYLLTDKV